MHKISLIGRVKDMGKMQMRINSVVNEGSVGKSVRLTFLASCLATSKGNLVEWSLWEGQGPRGPSADVVLWVPCRKHMGSFES